MHSKDRIVPVILSGGSGTRLWPLSRESRPKQFLPLTGTATLFQLAVARVQQPSLFATPLVVTNESHRFLVGEELQRSGSTDAQILLEPEGRNTAPAVALAALYLCETGADPLMLVMPSDHAIADVAGFHRAVEAGTHAADEAHLVTFGIRPTHPETGYGYIEADDPLFAGTCCRRVKRFVEKPDSTTAEAYLAAGNYFWNSGIFLFRARCFLDELSRHVPDMLAACETALARRSASPDFIRPDPQAFAASPADSIDYAVMEKSGRIAVVPADFGWSDIGSWSAVWEQQARDDDGNAATGDVLAEDCRNSLFKADGAAIAAVGVEDLIVVTSEDMVLVLPRRRAQEVKRIVDRLKAEHRREHIDTPGGGNTV